MVVYHDNSSMRLIVKYVCVAGPMGRTQYIISLSWPIGYVYVWRWKGYFCLCLTVILTLSVYVWRGRLIVASMLDALVCVHMVRSRLRPCCRHLSFVVAIVALLLLPLPMQYVAKWTSCTCAWEAHWQHMFLLQPCCYHCPHCATWYDSIARSCTRPCCSLKLYAKQYEIHKALLLLTLCDVTLKMACTCTQGLVVIAVMQRDVKCIDQYIIEALCLRAMANAKPTFWLRNLVL